MFGVRLLVLNGYGTPEIRRLQVINHQGYVLGTVAWNSDRHWTIERLCRDTGLALQVMDEVGAPMLIPYGHRLAVPLAPVPPVRWQGVPEHPPTLILARDHVAVADSRGDERTWPRLGSGDPREPLVSRLCGYRQPLQNALTPEQSFTLLTSGFASDVPRRPVIGVALLDPDNRTLCLVQCAGWLGPELEHACQRVGIALDEARQDDAFTEADAPAGAWWVPVGPDRPDNRG